VLGCIRFCGLLGVHPVHPRTEDRPARVKIWHPGRFDTWPRETPADIVILFKTFIQDTHETHRPGQGALQLLNSDIVNSLTPFEETPFQQIPQDP
jgi:hypothetical protein